MRHDRHPVTPSSCLEATARSAARRNGGESELARLADRDPSPFVDLARKEIQKRHNEMTSDARRDERREACLCQSCFYAARVAGAAMTHRECGLCTADTLFASTDTDVICKSCAATHDLCAHCGGDLDGDIDRTQYPTVSGAVSS